MGGGRGERCREARDSGRGERGEAMVDWGKERDRGRGVGEGLGDYMVNLDFIDAQHRSLCRDMIAFILSDQQGKRKP